MTTSTAFLHKNKKHDLDKQYIHVWVVYRPWIFTIVEKWEIIHTFGWKAPDEPELREFPEWMRGGTIGYPNKPGVWNN